MTPQQFAALMLLGSAYCVAGTAYAFWLSERHRARHTSAILGGDYGSLTFVLLVYLAWPYVMFRRWRAKPPLRLVIACAMVEMGGHCSTFDLLNHLSNLDVTDSMGAIYVELDRMQEEGMVASAMAPGGPERGYKLKRSVGLTDKGRDYLERHYYLLPQTRPIV